MPLQQYKTNRKERIEQIKEVLNAFGKSGIKYCLLRNYEFLLDDKHQIESLDTIVSENDLPQMDIILKRCGFTRRTQQFSLKHKAYFKIMNTQKVSFDIQTGGVYWNDMAYLNESMLERRKKKSFFYIPSDNDTFVMLIVHSILGKRYFKKKYQEIVRSIRDSGVEKEWAEKELARIFSKHHAKKILQCIKNNQFRRIPIYRLVLLFMIKKPARIWTFIRVFLRWLKWKKLLKPAPLISVIGPDGAGKSTLVASLREILSQGERKVSMVYSGRGRGQVLPIRRIGNRYKAAEKKRDKEQKLKNLRKRKMLYTLAAPIFTMDLLLRYWTQVLPKRMRKRIVITDRYCTDILLMKHVNYQFKMMLLAFFPKPTITIYMYNTPEILHNRRPEESVEELERQLSLFEKINSDIKIKSANIKNDTKIAAEEVLKKLLINWD